MGCFVHGAVLTLVGQYSWPLSTAARSIWQNLSSCSRRRATPSWPPSSIIPFFHFLHIHIPQPFMSAPSRHSSQLRATRGRGVVSPLKFKFESPCHSSSSSNVGAIAAFPCVHVHNCRATN